MASASVSDEANSTKRAKLLEPTIGIPLLCGAVAIVVFIIWRRSS